MVLYLSQTGTIAYFEYLWSSDQAKENPNNLGLRVNETRSRYFDIASYSVGKFLLVPMISSLNMRSANELEGVLGYVSSEVWFCSRRHSRHFYTWLWSLKLS